MRVFKAQTWQRKWVNLFFGMVVLGVAFTAGGVSRAAGLLVAEGGFGGVLKTKEHDVKVIINNGVAVTEVTQVFVNKENRIVEALYTFPVPNHASVANFSMWINGKEMIGEVVEKQRARQIYQSYKRQRKDPGLLEQVNYKQFEMRIFPIPAGGEQKVKVTYYQELDVDHDWATYVYPLATVTHRAVDGRTTGRFSLSLEVQSEVPITAMESPSHGEAFAIAEHDPRYYQASLETKAGDLSRDLVVAYHLERPQSGIDMIHSKVKEEDGYFMMTITAGKELEEVNQGMDYVFLLDISGSMAHESKLTTSRKSITAFIESLGTEDRFELLTFNVKPDTLFQKLHVVNETSRQQATEYLASQRARGGTVLRPAIMTAYRYLDSDRPLNVVVLSDGITQPREHRELLELIGQRPTGVRLFSIGVGNEVNRPLLRQLSEEAGGLAAFLSDSDNFERQAKAFRRKLLRPAMNQVQLNLEGVEAYDIEPRELPNLYYGSPVRVYGRYRGSGPMTVKIEAEVLGQPFEQSLQVEMPNLDEGNPEIERTWAWHRVQRLLAEQRRAGTANSQQEEIVRLCEDYSIVSEYASFLVLENNAEYQRWSIDRRNDQRMVRDRAARAARREQLRGLVDRSVASLGPRRESERMNANRGSASTNRQVTPNLPQSDRSPLATNRRRPVPQGPRNFNLGGRGGGSGGGFGGGAIDPVSAAVLLSLAGLGAWSQRRRDSAAIR